MSIDKAPQEEVKQVEDLKLEELYRKIISDKFISFSESRYAQKLFVGWKNGEKGFMEKLYKYLSEDIPIALQARKEASDADGKQIPVSGEGVAQAAAASVSRGM